MKAKSLMTAAALVLVLAANNAYADTISLRYSTDDATWTTVSQGAAPFDVFAGPVSAGMFNLLLLAGQGSPALSPGSLDLASVVRTNAGGGPGTLFVELTQDNITTPTGNWTVQFAPVFTGSGLTLNFSTWADDANGLFVKSIPIAALGPLTQTNLYTANGAAAVTAPYSVTQRLVISCPGTPGGCAPGSGFTGNALLTVPEPTSLVLLGTGLLTLVGWMRRRSRRGEV